MTIPYREWSIWVEDICGGVFLPQLIPDLVQLSQIRFSCLHDEVEMDVRRTVREACIHVDR